MNQGGDIFAADSLASVDEFIGMESAPAEKNLKVVPGSREEVCGQANPVDDRRFILIYLILHGKVKVQLARDFFELGPNDLFIVPQNLVFEAPHLHLCKGYFVHFKSEFLQPLLKRPIETEFSFLGLFGNHFYHLSSECCVSLKRAFEDIIREYREQASEKEQLLQHYLEILLLKIRELSRSLPQSDNYLPSSSLRIVYGFKNLLEAHFHEIRMVKQYAEMLNISPGHLSDTVHEVMGKSPRAIINDMLVHEAQCLLRSSDKSISEIAFQLGFDDQAHFYHFMKLHTGNSPTALRKSP